MRYQNKIANTVAMTLITQGVDIEPQIFCSILTRSESGIDVIGFPHFEIQ